jgi:cytochrome P450
VDFVFNPVDPRFLEDPYPVYARLRDEAPVHRHPGGFFVVARHADVVYVLKHPELFSSAAMGGQRPVTRADGRSGFTSGSLIGEDPPVHTQQRNIVSRGFTPRRIADLEPRVRSVADELFAGFEGRDGCDLVAELADPLPVTVIAELLGLEPERRDDFKRWSTALIIRSTQASGARSRDFDEILEFRAYMQETIERRRSSPGDDLVSLLIRAEQDEGILDAEQVIGFASLLLAAGSETTTNLIGNTLLALRAWPEARERVHTDPSLLPRVIEESLRYDAPVQLLMRLATQELELGGERLPRGSLVLVLIGSANRDEERFAEPDRFDLDRDTRDHLAFGFGHHFCLGASLARLEGLVALEGVFERLPDFTIAEEDIPRHGSMLVRGPSRLPLRFEPRRRRPSASAGRSESSTNRAG